MHIATEVLMIRPAPTGFTEGSALSRTSPDHESVAALESSYDKALEEFESLASALKAVGIEVHIFEDTQTYTSSGPIWTDPCLSFDTTGEIIQYPLSNPSQRPEILADILQFFLDRDSNFSFVDLSEYETLGVFLEGSHSIVFDRRNRIAYAFASKQTHIGFFERFCKYFYWEPFIIQAENSLPKPLSHTSQLLGLGDKFAILCGEALSEPIRLELQKKLEEGGRECIVVSYEQMKDVAYDLVELQNREGDSYLLLSKKVLDSLKPPMVRRLEGFTNLLPVSLAHLKKQSGRGARGVLTEVFSYQPQNSIHETKDYE